MGTRRRAGIAAAIAAAQVGLDYRFALAYRARAGFPRRFPPTISPADVGLPFESLTVASGELTLPAWFIPARGGEPGPGVTPGLTGVIVDIGTLDQGIDLTGGTDALTGFEGVIGSQFSDSLSGDAGANTILPPAPTTRCQGSSMSSGMCLSA